MAFAIAAGAVLSVEHADVHVFHTEVAVNLGGLGADDFKQAKQHDNHR